MKKISLRFALLFFTFMLFCSFEAIAQPLDMPPPLDQPRMGRPHRARKIFPLLGIAKARYNKAQIYENQGKIDMAIEEMKKVLDLDIPKDREAFEIKVHAYNYIADLYIKSNQGNKALEIIEKAIEEAPENSVFASRLYLTKGEIYRRLGQDDKALETFDKAIGSGEKLFEKGGEPFQNREKDNK